MVNKVGKVIRYSLYIGMNDKEKLEQLLPKEKFIELVRNICSSKKISFSMGELYGGYLMDNGKYIMENALELSLTGLNKQQVYELAEKLKVIFNQETILINKDIPEVYLIK